MPRLESGCWFCVGSMSGTVCMRCLRMHWNQMNAEKLMELREACALWAKSTFRNSMTPEEFYLKIFGGGSIEAKDR